MTIRDPLGTINFGCLDPRNPPDCDEGVNIEIGGLDQGYSSEVPNETPSAGIIGQPLVNGDVTYLWLGSFGELDLWYHFFVGFLIFCAS